MLTKQEESIFRSKLGLTIMKYFGISFVIALASGVATTLLLNCFIRENGISGETVELLSYMVTIAVLFVVFLKLFHKKIRYIHTLEHGIEIIEGGGLEYPIPVEGDDELTALAIQLNDMRRTLQKQINERETAIRENHEMVTAISHDIRTPLTSVICYLDLIRDGKVKSPEEEAVYINNALEKACQIKNLTTALFSHSVAENEEVMFHYELIDGNELLAQVLSESVFLLEEKGPTVQVKDSIAEGFAINVDIQQFRRVFDNLCSNALKYADPRRPISFDVMLEPDTLRIIQTNQVRKNSGGESFGIGLKTCEKIAERHEGTFKSWIEKGEFVAIWTLPLY